MPLPAFGSVKKDTRFDICVEYIYLYHVLVFLLGFLELTTENPDAGRLSSLMTAQLKLFCLSFYDGFLRGQLFTLTLGKHTMEYPLWTCSQLSSTKSSYTAAILLTQLLASIQTAWRAIGAESRICFAERTALQPILYPRTVKSLFGVVLCLPTDARHSLPSLNICHVCTFCRETLLRKLFVLGAGATFYVLRCILTSELATRHSFS